MFEDISIPETEYSITYSLRRSWPARSQHTPDFCNTSTKACNALRASGLSASFLNIDVFLSFEMKESSLSTEACDLGETENCLNDNGLYARGNRTE